ncbi:MAG: hypothetical protein IBX43_08910 [Campylobacterales bacterium]|nr:hypothetical protein [Campylobacterales bacterium]
MSVLFAILGAEIEVRTLDGTVSLTVSQGTQPNAVLRLGKKGLPCFAQKKRGDLYLRITVHVPESLSEEERGLYVCLRRLGREKKHFFKMLTALSAPLCCYCRCVWCGKIFWQFRRVHADAQRLWH